MSMRCSPTSAEVQTGNRGQSPRSSRKKLPAQLLRTRCSRPVASTTTMSALGAAVRPFVQVHGSGEGHRGRFAPGAVAQQARLVGAVQRTGRDRRIFGAQRRLRLFVDRIMTGARQCQRAQQRSQPRLRCGTASSAKRHDLSNGSTASCQESGNRPSPPVSFSLSWPGNGGPSIRVVSHAAVPAWGPPRVPRRPRWLRPAPEADPGFCGGRLPALTPPGSPILILVLILIRSPAQAAGATTVEARVPETWRAAVAPVAPAGQAVRSTQAVAGPRQTRAA